MRLFIVFLLPIFLASCSSVDCASYKEADKLTYDSIAEEYLQLVKEAQIEGKPKYNQDEQDRRARLVESWKLRISRSSEYDKAKDSGFKEQ